MIFPEILQAMLPSATELSQGKRSGYLPCPERDNNCGGRCVECETSKAYHAAFRSIGSGLSGETIAIRLDNCRETTVHGVGSFETRDGNITYEFIPKLDWESFRKLDKCG